MKDFSESKIKWMTTHGIGNKTREEKLVQPDMVVDGKHFGEIEQQQILKLCVHPFAKEYESYRFYDEMVLEHNDVYLLASEMFDKPDVDILFETKEMAKHLYEYSTHPKFAGGVLIIVGVSDIVLNDELVDGICILSCNPTNYYSTKDSFLTVNEKGFKDVERGCWIFNTEKENGYVCQVIDNNKTNVLKKIWREDFLKVKVLEDNYFQTKELASCLNGFIKDVYNEHNNIEEIDQIDMKNKVKRFFEETEDFSQEYLNEDVFGEEPEVVEAFENYKQSYQEQNEVQLQDEFEVNREAAKAAKRQFKSVLKLDKNFHVYIHGGRERVEKGFDEDKGLNFVKLYYKEEA